MSKKRGKKKSDESDIEEDDVEEEDIEIEVKAEEAEDDEDVEDEKIDGDVAVDPDFEVVETEHDSKRYVLKVVDKSQRLMSEFMTRAEYTEVVAVRCKHLEMGNKPYVDTTGLSLKQIVQKEISEKKCPLAIIRKYNRTLCELWEVNELGILWVTK